MLYIYMNTKGRQINNKDRLFFLATIEDLNLEYKILGDVTKQNVNKDDLIFLYSSDTGFEEDYYTNLNSTNTIPSKGKLSDLYNKSKFAQYCELNNLPHPKIYNKEVEYPLVFKPTVGSLGESVSLCNDETELGVAIDNFNGDYVLQQFINTGKFASKYRIIFYKNEVILKYKDINYDKTSIISNLEVGSTVDLENIPFNCEEVLKEFRKGTDLLFGCLDIIVDSMGNLYYLEVNSIAKLYRISNIVERNLYKELFKKLLDNHYI